MAFGALAPFYDAWYKTPLGVYVWSAETRAMKTMRPPQVSGVVIDIGTGTGMSLSLLQDFTVHFVGIDIAWQMMKIAYQKTGKSVNVHLVLADGEQLPFRKGVAELVLGMTVLEFVSNPEQLLREIHSVLYSPGWLLLGILTSTNLWALERRIRSFARPDVFSFARFPMPWEVTRLLTRTGFFDVHYQGSVYAPTFTPYGFLASFLRIETKLSNRWLCRALGAFLVVRAQR